MLSAREIVSCGLGCNPGVVISKNRSQKSKQFTAFSDRQFLKRHFFFHGVNVSK
jgi:hypothetical protein